MFAMGRNGWNNSRASAFGTDTGLVSNCSSGCLGRGREQSLRHDEHSDSRRGRSLGALRMRAVP